jgi:MFS family permease
MNWLGFVGARGIGLLADEMFLFAVPVALYASTHDVRSSGLAITALTLARILFMPWVASLADRFGVRKQYLITDSTRFAVAALIFAVAGAPWPVFALTGIWTLLSGHAFVLFEKTVAAVSTDGNRGQLQARLQVVEQLARVLGPACAGMVLQFHQLAGIAVALMGAYGFSAVLIALYFRPVERDEARAVGSARRDLATALAIIGKRPELVWIIGLSMAANLVEGVMLILAPMMVLTRFGRGEGDIGAFFSLSAAASIAVLALLSMRKGLRIPARLSSPIVAAMAAIALVLPMSPSFVDYCSLYLTFIVLRSAFVVHARAERSRLVDAADFGKVLGVIVSLLLLPLPMAGLVVSIGAPLIGPKGVLWGATAFALSATVVLRGYLVRRAATASAAALNNSEQPARRCASE